MTRLRTRALDWDGTLVDPQSQEWLPGARLGLLSLLQESRAIIVHTCRANWPEGRAAIEAKLESEPALRHYLRAGVLTMEGKPRADDYLDNQAIHFSGSWPKALLDLRQAAA